MFAQLIAAQVAAGHLRIPHLTPARCAFGANYWQVQRSLVKSRLVLSCLWS